MKPNQSLHTDGSYRRRPLAQLLIFLQNDLTISFRRVQKMRRLIPLLCCFAVSVNGNAHESTSVGATMHALYHKVKASYILINTLKLSDALRLSDPSLGHLNIYSYYFDPVAESLYSCIEGNDSGVCSGPERATKISWTDQAI